MINKKAWANIFLVLSIAFFILFMYCGITEGVPIGKELTVGTFIPRFLVTLVIIIFCGGLYMLTGLIAKTGLFPIYYGILKAFRRNERIYRLQYVKERLIIGFTIWLMFSVYYMLAGPSSQLDFLKGKRILALPIGALVAPIFGLAFWLCWPIGKFMIYPFIRLYRHFS